MSNHKFDVGDVVRLNSPAFGKMNGETCIVVRIETDPYKHLIVRTDNGKELAAQEFCVDGVPLEEVQRYYADKPRRGFIVDGLTVDETLVDELESGQDEAYQTFRTAANEANREEEQRAAEEDRKDRRVLAELTVMSIIWVVFTFVSLAMWLVVMWTGETACAPIGYYSALVSVVAVVKPMYALILVCREHIKERRKRKEGP